MQLHNNNYLTQTGKRNLLGQLPIDTPEIQSLLDKYAS